MPHQILRLLRGDIVHHVASHHPDIGTTRWQGASRAEAAKRWRAIPPAFSGFWNTFNIFLWVRDSLCRDFAPGWRVTSYRFATIPGAPRNLFENVDNRVIAAED